ncbi:unnamed protein product [Rotaria sp. Silwood1]|nr:unnamed protein product [Rotaria sp. Silwood1]CAF1656144.1 unnamed protein product [Rotaria sp. Silwood1]CAF3869071.1 unnamed protein product [Rotaria sp. Silwood1]CAF3892969.1 unnamed protein product [Rotaria sp. Silwood1]CAF5001594.1 unnamed protein product [Rotaria sp. Silwood1]
MSAQQPGNTPADVSETTGSAAAVVNENQQPPNIDPKPTGRSFRSQIPKRTPYDEIVADMKATDEEANKYKFLTCVPRTVVLIGRTRTGKTTMRNVIENPMHISEPFTLKSHTKEVSIKCIAAYLQHENQVHNINIIDTPGFYDRVTAKAAAAKNGGKQQTQRQNTTNSPDAGTDDDAPLSNEDISAYIDKCIYNDITQIHVFAFVFTLGTQGINAQDLQTMQYFKRKYPQLSKHFALIITHCEELGEANMKQLVKQFFEDKEVRETQLEGYFNLGVHFMGSIRNESLKEGSRDEVGRQMINVLDMREKFIKFLFAQNQPYNIHEDITQKRGSAPCKIL